MDSRTATRQLITTLKGSKDINKILRKINNNVNVNVKPNLLIYNPTLKVLEALVDIGVEITLEILELYNEKREVYRFLLSKTKRSLLNNIGPFGVRLYLFENMDILFDYIDTDNNPKFELQYLISNNIEKNRIVATRIKGRFGIPASCNEADAIRDLISLGADVNHECEYGDKPIFYFFDSPDIVRVLIEGGADCHGVDVNGYNLLDLVILNQEDFEDDPEMLNNWYRPFIDFDELNRFYREELGLVPTREYPDDY